MKEAYTGVQYLLDGFSLIAKPGLRRFVIIPAIINIIFFIGLFFIAGHFLGKFNVWFYQHVPVWLEWLAIIFWLFFIVSFFLFFIYTFVIVANFIAAPFNGLLAEKVELFLTGQLVAQKSLWENIKDVPHILGRQLHILAYYVPRALLLIIFFFIPLLQIFAPIFWFIFNAWFMAITYVDYPTDNHRVSLFAMRAWLNARRTLTLGFGITVLFATMLPIINLFTIPAAVAGATKLWLMENAKK